MSAPTLTRQERERLAMEEEIVATALAMVRAEGVANLSLREVAKRMEYSSAALYRYFPDKAALVDELCRRGFVLLTARLRGVPASLPPAERLRRAGLAYLRFAADEPHLYTMMFVDMLPGEAAAPQSYTGAQLRNDAAFAALYDVLADGVAAGAFHITDDDLLAVALAFWALVHGYALLRARWPNAFTTSAMELGFTTLIAGIATPRH
jgi:AcrR family transcriptional regulator